MFVSVRMLSWLLFSANPTVLDGRLQRIPTELTGDALDQWTNELPEPAENSDGAAVPVLPGGSRRCQNFIPLANVRCR